MPSSAYRAEDLEAKYDVVLNYPNLELHSAAASGNVGLVHYALTHGQPVNSVLHGVLPLHAACSGGSVSVVRMLIERGADVNAPRLPRRYSDGKRSNAPSVGAAGSTPLHFAAANGHAPIVQILLTCGATPDKEDKNGMTPESLAETNGHTDVIRVLRVWEHLQRTESHSAGRLSSIDVAASDQADVESPSASTSGQAISRDESAGELHERYSSFGSLGSRKGKERAMSITSGVSEANSSTAVKVKQSFEALFRGRASRSTSFASMHIADDSPTGLKIFTRSDHSFPMDLDQQASPIDASYASSSPIGAANSIDRENSGLSARSRDSSAGMGNMGSEQHEGDTVSPLMPTPPRPGLGRPPVRSNSKSFGSYRRPSLPSIFEKAAHPGSAFRNAFRRHDHSDSPPTPGHSPGSRPSPSTSSSSPRSPPGLFRGRRMNGKNVSPTSYKIGRQYGQSHRTKYALFSLFRRGHSPHSRSPSPPKRIESKNRPITSEDLDEGIEKLRRASLDMHLQQGRPAPPDDVRSLFSDPGPMLSHSAPVTKTSFFLDDAQPMTFSSLAIDPTIDPAMIPLPRSPSSTSLASAVSEQPPPVPPVPQLERRTRSRHGSEVIAPSPLANELMGHASDSDSPSAKIRRSNSGMVKSSSQSTLTSPTPTTSGQPSTASSPSGPSIQQKQRSQTLPSGISRIAAPPRSSSGGGRIMGLGWGEGVDLRKVASGMFRRRSTRNRTRSGSTPSSLVISDPIPISTGNQNIANGGIGRVSEEKSDREDDKGDTETIKLAGDTSRQSEEARSDTIGRPSDEAGSREGGADADVEDEDEEFHDAEDASIFAQVIYPEPAEMDGSLDRPHTPVVIVESPADETGAATLQVLHSPHEERDSPFLGLATAPTSPVPTQTGFSNDAGDSATPTGDTDIDDEHHSPPLDNDRATSEETERGDRPPEAAAHALGQQVESSDSITPPAVNASAPELTSPTPQRRPGPPRSKFVEILAPEDVQIQRAEQTSPSRVWSRWGRYRGASVGSGSGTTAESTRLVTPPSLRMSLLSSDDSQRSPVSPTFLSTSMTNLPPAQPPSVSSDSRNRGMSVSSMSSSASGMAFSYIQSTTPSTSLTPPSTLSLGALPGAGFPPVPEDEVMHGHPRRHRKASTSAEARQIIKQTEDDILQLAQMPDSLDSSRSLAAQLAAYGENHALEEHFSEREARSQIGTEDGESDKDSFFSARSEGAASRVGSIYSGILQHRPPSIASARRGPVPASLYSAEAPATSSVPSINNIYDRRATAYRDRMTALTLTNQPALPSSLSTHSRGQPSSARARSVVSTEAWKNAGPSNVDDEDAEAEDVVDLHPDISSPLPMVSTSLIPTRPAGRKASMPPSVHQPGSKPSSLAPSVIRSTRSLSLSPIPSRLTASGSFGIPNPINEVSARYGGISQPMQSLGSVGAVAAAGRSASLMGRSPSILSHGSGMSGSPYVSIFSNRFSAPGDGDDSDDEEQQEQNYTLIENDWRGGHVVDPESFEKKKKWGHLKGAFGKGQKRSVT